jgi:protein-disulfide isomerase
MNTNATGPIVPSDVELLAGLRRRMAGVEPLIPSPGPWSEASAEAGAPVRIGVRSRIGFAGFAPLVLVAALVVVAVGYGLGSKTWGGAGSDDSMTTLTSPALPAIVAPSALTPTDIPSSGRTLGNANAPVTLDFWGDFQCSACSSFAVGTEQQLIDNYVKQGKLKIVYHDFTVIDSMNGGHDSENAAAAARIAADQGKFWIFSDYLWANQQNEQAGEFSRDRLIEVARLAGLDVAKFTTDLDAGKYLAEVRAESAAGQAAGYVGAPTLLVNGKQAGTDGMVPDYATISAAIDRSLAAPSPSASSSAAATSSAVATSSAAANPSPAAIPSPTLVPTFPGPADVASPSASR